METGIYGQLPYPHTRQFIMTKIVASCIFAIGFCLCVSPASASIVFNPGNGSYYEAVDHDQTWVQANAAAEATFYMGRQGHLATITSQAEQDFVVNNVPGA